VTKIKICGITEERDAIEAVHFGVDAIGFVFSKNSARYLPPRAAGRIVAKLPPFLAKVGVFVNEPADAVMDAVYAAGLTALQFHGEEAPEYCRRFTLPWYKTFRVGAAFDLDRLAAYECTTYLLEGDAGSDGGGEGPPDRVAARAARSFGRVVIGGALGPETVGNAIAAVEPYAVDVAGGVEFAPGKKDVDRMEAFVRAVRAADLAVGAAENAD
jgi:phosphoribosylanthranilate isomerase